MLELRGQATLPVGTVAGLSTLFIAEVGQSLIELVDVLLPDLMIFRATIAMRCEPLVKLRKPRGEASILVRSDRVNDAQN